MSSGREQPPMTRRPATAFSLLELLLVVGIIAILAALLLPAVTKTYTRAKRAKCLKQIGVGFHAFAHEQRFSRTLNKAKVL